MKRTVYVFGAGLLLFFGNLYIYSLLVSDDRSTEKITRQELRQQLDALKAAAALQAVKQEEIKRNLDAIQAEQESERVAAVPQETVAAVAHQPPPDVVLPILLFACNRPTVDKPLREIIKYRPSAEKFPIIVSQDCEGHAPTANAIGKFKADILKHIIQPDNSKIILPPKEKKFEGYHKISRHYKWALGQVFDEMNYEAVILLEDDLEISPDFFEYFEATYSLLKEDDSLYCVSAWNDNGKQKIIQNNSSLLWRTDFFPGLGWMLQQSVWEELKPQWPSGFWDDWIRQDAQRKGRACIRPEISRTSTFGKVGVSKGFFFDKHLKFIVLNWESILFKAQDLTYLHKDVYDAQFVKTVYGSPSVGLKDLQSIVDEKKLNSVRIQYSTQQSFKQIAKVLNIMDDFKEGVPRTAYRGVVPIMFSGLRVYISPPANWKEYNPTWT